MAQLKLAQLFEYRNVTPSGLQKGNLISFKYSSPNGVHDKAPLVYVLDKTFDKIYGINIHYELNELQELVDGIEEKVNVFLEKKWYAKYPQKINELKKSRTEFDKSLIEKKDLIEFSRSFNKKDLEIFNIGNYSNEGFRSYLFKRMNNVSRLVFKLT